jgi:hypothetical protein
MFLKSMPALRQDRGLVTGQRRKREFELYIAGIGAPERGTMKLTPQEVSALASKARKAADNLEKQARPHFSKRGGNSAEFQQALDEYYEAVKECYDFFRISGTTGINPVLKP